MDELSAAIKYDELAKLISKILDGKEPGWDSADLLWRASRNSFDLAENCVDDKDKKMDLFFKALGNPSSSFLQARRSLFI